MTDTSPTDPLMPDPAVTRESVRSAFEELRRLERIVVAPPSSAERIREALLARGLPGFRIVSSPAVPEGMCFVLNPEELRRRLEDAGARGHRYDLQPLRGLFEDPAP